MHFPSIISSDFELLIPNGESKANSENQLVFKDENNYFECFSSFQSFYMQFAPHRTCLQTLLQTFYSPMGQLQVIGR